MLRSIWRHLTDMVRIWFAPKFDLTSATTGRWPSGKSRAGRAATFSKPRAYLARRLAEGRGNKDFQEQEQL